MKIEKLKPQDLHCNIFSVYDYDSVSIQELLCLFFTKINQCIEISNYTLELAEWLVNQGLKEEVAKKLELWLVDGTLAEIINETIFKELNEKIDNGLLSVNNRIDNVVQNVNDNHESFINYVSEYNGIKMRGTEPMFMCELETLPGSVTQGIAVDKNTNLIYVSQKYIREEDLETGQESFRVIRCYPNGLRKDYMEFIKGGHGTTFGLEVENGEVYIYSSWTTEVVNGLPNADVPHRIGRIKYEPFKKVLPCDVDIEFFNTPSKKYFIPTISANYDYIALRNDREVYIYKLDEFKNLNLNNVKRITIPSEYYYLQGFTLDDKYFYWRSGDGVDPENNHTGMYDDIISKYSIETGDLLEVKKLNYQIKNGAYEPEDIYILQVEDEQCMVLTGQIGGRYARQRSCWAMGNNDLTLSFLGQANTPNEKTEPWLSGWGKCKWVDPNINKFSDITDPGWYYFDSVQYSKMIDRPSDEAETSAYFLFVSPKGKTESNLYQELTRCSASRGGFYRTSRYVDIVSGETSPWLGSSQDVILWSGDTSSMNVGDTITLKETLDNFDFVYMKYTGMGGGNSDTMLIPINGMSLHIIKQGLNFGDNDVTKFYFYEHDMELNADKTTMTLRGQRRYWINNNQMGGDLNSKDYGLIQVVGIRM